MESQKNHTYITTSGTQIQIKHVPTDATTVHTIEDILLSNRGLKADDTLFFAPTYEALHDPYLLPDMYAAVARILRARDTGERVVIFGDYDVDGVSSTAMLVRYMTEIGMQVSYRLPHRVHDGYGLKEYFFDELAEKNVKLVITVDCGTRDILPIRYAKNLGIDVIVTDHHAVPAEVPTEVVGIVNPKRTDSIYPFSSLAGAGVAFKLLHAICMEISRDTSEDIYTTQNMIDGIPPGERGLGGLSKDTQGYIEYNIQKKKYATELRRNMTPTEKKLWYFLRADTENTWLRQKILGEYIVDFYCSKKHLVIELDGETHIGREEYDAARTQYLESIGLYVLRFSNTDIYENIEYVRETIAQYINRDTDKSPTYGTPFIKGESLEDAPYKKKYMSEDIQKTLSRYIEFAALGTVSDCMPLVGENRTIVTLGLQAMAHSTSSGLRQFLAEKDDIVGNADIIGFQIGPRINAAGRMDTPVKALQWLLAGDVRAGELFQEIEHLNEERKEATISYLEDALHTADPADGILFYDSPTIEHGVIGLVAGRLTEQYNRPSICLRDEGDTLVASCRSPAWCDLIGLLDICKSYFVRYGGHRQAAGFTIEKSQYIPFKNKIREVFGTVHTMTDLPKKVLYVEASISPVDISLPTLDILDTFRPYGIGNPPPLFLLEDMTVSRCEFLGKGEDHICIYLVENPGVKYVMWRWQETLCTTMEHIEGVHTKAVHIDGLEDLKTGKSLAKNPPYTAGDILSVVVSLERNTWKGKTSISGVIKEVVR